MRKNGSQGGGQPEGPRQRGKKASSFKCYNCGGREHCARQCPSKDLFCHGQGWQRRQGLTLNGVVEGQVVDGILLDTGCSKTLVRRK